MIFLFLQSLTQALTYYLFVSVIGKSYGPETIGEGAAVISLAGFIASIANLGIYSGLPKAFGEYYGKNDHQTSRNIVSSSLLIISTTTIVSILLLFYIPIIQEQTKLPFPFIIIAAAIIPLLTFSGLIKIILTSILHGRDIFVSSCISSVAGLSIGFVLLNYGYGSIAVATGIAMINGIPAILISKAAWKWIDLHAFNRNIISATKLLLRPSLSSWIPSVLGVAGVQIGTLVIYADRGSTDAGIYFIAYALYSVVTFINYAFNSVTLPVISGMPQGREQYAVEAIRLQFVMIAPVVACGIVFSVPILTIFGAQYVQGKEVLQILLLSILPQTVATGLRQLFYAEGKNRHIIFSGIFSDGTRIILLFVLVHFWGNIGGAISMTAGSIIALIYYSALSSRLRVRLPWKKFVLLIVIPCTMTIIFFYYPINYIIGSLLLISLSLIIYIRLQLLTKNDANNVIAMMVPTRYASKLITITNGIIDRIIKH